MNKRLENICYSKRENSNYKNRECVGVALLGDPQRNEIKKFKRNSAITLIALVITIIVLLILAGITLTFVLGENGIIQKSKNAKEETRKSTATETMNLKITNVEMSKYVEKQRMPTLKEMADDFCEDNDFEYVHETRKNASLTKINNENPDSIYTKLKAYPYEFEINSSLQLASIDGVQIASNNDTSGDYVSRAQYESLLARVVALENVGNLQTNLNNYTTTEKVVGKWVDGSNVYGKIIDLGTSFTIKKDNNYELPSNIMPSNLDIPIKSYFMYKDTNGDRGSTPCYIFLGLNGKYTYKAMDSYGPYETANVYLYIEYTKNEQ